VNDIFKIDPISNRVLASQGDPSADPDFQHCPRTQALIESFGGPDTFVRVLQLSIKIVEPASTEKSKNVMHWFSSNFLNLKERMRAQTGRAELRRRLQAMADRANQDLNELADFEILSRLVDAERSDRGSCSMVDVERRRRALEERARFAAIAAAKIPPGKGDKRADGDISPEELCAFMVHHAWYVARGAQPAPQSLGALSACEELWLAAGGKASTAKETSPVKWRRHLEHASRRRRQGTNGAAFVRGGDGRIVLVEAKLPERSSTLEA
jgi:hypothetical protein